MRLKPVTVYIGTFLFIMLSFGCSQQVKYENELENVCKNINAKCPKMLDSETRFEGVQYLAPNAIHYKYTLVNMGAAVVDTHAFNNSLWPGLVSNIKVSHDMKKLREHETTLFYSYFDKSSRLIYTFTITANDYK